VPSYAFGTISAVEKKIMSEINVERILDKYKPSPDIIEIGKRRQAAISKGEETDYVPIVLSARELPEVVRDLPEYTIEECYYDKEKMLLTGLKDMFRLNAGRSDGVPSIRPNLGVGLLATVLGAKQQVRGNQMPWVTERVSKQDLARLEPCDFEDVNEKGEMPWALEYINYFRKKLEGKAYVFSGDPQGPFDIAHLVYGNDIFTAIYDDPSFVHHLLHLCSKVYIEGMKSMKRAMGEPLDIMYHYNGLYMEGCSTRIAEDTATLLKKEHAEEFAFEYTRKVLAEFGGGWTHWCGRGEQLLDLLDDAPEIKGLNLGNPQFYSMPAIIKCLRRNKQFYWGCWPRDGEESLDDYFRRHLKSLVGCRSTLILVAELQKEDNLNAPEAVDLWRGLQDEMLSEH